MGFLGSKVSKIWILTNKFGKILGAFGSKNPKFHPYAEWYFNILFVNLSFSRRMVQIQCHVSGIVSPDPEIFL